MRITSLFFGRHWALLLPAVIALSSYRIEDLRVAHQEIWNLTQRYAGIQQQLRQIRAESLKHIRIEQQ